MGENANENYRGQRVLVTGGTGFIGARLARRLNSCGAIVHVTSRRTDATLDGATCHSADLADAGAVAALVQRIRPAYVFHLASRVSGSRSIDEVEPTFTGNLASTVNLLRAVTGTDCKRIVLAGSLEKSRNEAPSSPYAAAKAAASMYAQMFFQLYQTPVTIARIFMVYGPGQGDVRKLVPYVAVSLLSGKSPRLTSGARPVDWVYVDDVVDALLSMATSTQTLGKTIDVGTGQLTTVRSVAEQIGKLVGKASPVFGTVAERSLEQVRSANPTDTQAAIGRRMTPLDEGLQRTVDWYREKLEAGEIAPAAVK